ncbi:hypothetical protein [Sphingobacterium spiritivorum]|nr:hypothetical protein [Sphingobacterium spiritivorum]
MNKHKSAIVTFVLLLCFLIFLITGFSIAAFYDYRAGIALVLLLLYCIFVFRALLWYLMGEETIGIDQNHLIIVKKAGFFTQSRRFDLQKIKDLKYENHPYSFMDFFVSRTALTSLAAYGVIAFEYDKIQRIGIGIEKEEAERIIVLIKMSLKANKHRQMTH